MYIQIGQMNVNDLKIISTAFEAQGWNKPINIYIGYLEEQKINKRITLIAEIDNVFAGYINILWDSHYPAFFKDNIPEINDFNVLIKYRNMGLGNKLIDKAEKIIKKYQIMQGLTSGFF